MLYILARPQQQLHQNADFWEYTETRLKTATEFRGVSFLSSVSFIEKYLLPRYSRVTLILGLSDNGKDSFGKRLAAHLNGSGNFLDGGVFGKRNYEFANVSTEDEQKVEKDFLFPIKSVLKKALDQFEMFDQVEEYFQDNYDYLIFMGRNDWTMLVNQADVGTDITFVKQEGQLMAQINKHLFNKVSDRTSRNNGSMMNRYFYYLPRKYHNSYQYTSTGFIVNVANFDKWLNSDTLLQHYQTSQDARHEQELKNQAKLTEAITKLTAATVEQRRHRGIFGWFKR